MCRRIPAQFLIHFSELEFTYARRLGRKQYLIMFEADERPFVSANYWRDITGGLAVVNLAD